MALHVGLVVPDGVWAQARAARAVPLVVVQPRPQVVGQGLGAAANQLSLRLLLGQFPQLCLHLLPGRAGDGPAVRFAVVPVTQHDFTQPGLIPRPVRPPAADTADTSLVVAAAFRHRLPPHPNGLCSIRPLRLPDVRQARRRPSRPFWAASTLPRNGPARDGGSTPSPVPPPFVAGRLGRSGTLTLRPPPGHLSRPPSFPGARRLVLLGQLGQ